MLTLFGLSICQPLDDNGSIVPGGKITFLAAGTEDLKTTYADANGDAENTNPVELDGAGRAVIFLANDGAYDIVFRQPDTPVDVPGAIIWTLTGVIAAAPAVEE